MIEKRLKRQAVYMALLTIVSSLVLCAAAIGMTVHVLNVADETEYAQTVAIAKEYRMRITSQIDKNMQILATLAYGMSEGDYTGSLDKATQIIQVANAGNSFVGMAYFGADRIGSINIVGYDTEYNVELEALDDAAIAAIEKSFEGENAVSRIFTLEVNGQMLFSCSVPVYSGEEVIGVLSAIDTIDFFDEIANGNAVMGGSGYVHVLDSTGRFLVRSPHSLVKERPSTILEQPYVLDDPQEVIDAMEAQRSMFGNFTYDGTACRFYLEPIGINNWYLFCVNRRWATVYTMQDLVVVMPLFSVGFLLVVTILSLVVINLYRTNTKRLLRAAYWDKVTGAANTVQFDDIFNEKLSGGTGYSTVAINVHNFKGVNDLFGSAGGDKVLQYVKSVIQENLRPGEFFCRDSADLFYLALLDTDEETIRARLENIRQTVSHASATAGEYSYELTLYAGVAVNGGREKALVAMQSIKNNHTVGLAFYSDKLHDKIRKKNDIESVMFLALRNKEFKLFLQPKTALDTGRLSSAEALVRWRNADGSYRYPKDFIPIFEENGFCTNLDMYMVEQACEQIRTWIDAGVQPIPISVNQSKTLFSDGNYPNHLEQIVDRYGVSHSLIVLEILESMASDDLSLLQHQIETLHSNGFKVSMDDFGSGYSSLSMLYKLKIDELKLDRSFLIETSDEDKAKREVLLSHIIKFSSALGITTIAEGVETEEDRQTMLRLGCDYGQGYLYDKPLCADEFDKKYMRGSNRTAQG